MALSNILETIRGDFGEGFRICNNHARYRVNAMGPNAIAPDPKADDSNLNFVLRSQQSQTYWVSFNCVILLAIARKAWVISAGLSALKKCSASVEHCKICASPAVGASNAMP